jgi:hypothetical protein
VVRVCRGAIHRVREGKHNLPLHPLKRGTRKDMTVKQEIEKRKENRGKLEVRSQELEARIKGIREYNLISLP